MCIKFIKTQIVSWFWLHSSHILKSFIIGLLKRKLSKLKKKFKPFFGWFDETHLQVIQVTKFNAHDQRLLLTMTINWRFPFFYCCIFQISLFEIRAWFDLKSSFCLDFISCFSRFIANNVNSSFPQSFPRFAKAAVKTKRGIRVVLKQ